MRDRAADATWAPSPESLNRNPMSLSSAILRRFQRGGVERLRFAYHVAEPTDPTILRTWPWTFHGAAISRASGYRPAR